MEQKVMLVDVSKWTACRACQVACKQWNRLPAEKSEQRGTHQNPPDLNWATWNRIRFTEVSNKEGALKWLFVTSCSTSCWPRTAWPVGSSRPTPTRRRAASSTTTSTSRPSARATARSRTATQRVDHGRGRRHHRRLGTRRPPDGAH